MGPLGPSANVRAVPIGRVRESQRPRGGRRFIPVAEKELRGDALRAIRGLPAAHRGVFVVREVAGPFGIPDFLAVVGPALLLRRRIALGVPPLLNEVDAGIVAHASITTGKTVDRFAKELGWGAEAIDRRLPGLLRVGGLQLGRAGRYTRPADLVPVGRLYAVETKVRGFRRALRQARTYSLWCQNYVIVMASLSEGSISDALATVASDRGGLVVGGKWIKRPGARRLSPPRHLWGSEHLVAAASSAFSPALGGGE